MRELFGVKIAAIGPVTAAAVQALNVNVDLIAQDFKAEGLLKVLGKKVAGKKVLIPRAAEGREVLVTGLKKLRAKVTDVETYRTRFPQRSKQNLHELFRSEKPQWAIFTSSLMVHHFAKAVGNQSLSEWLSGVNCAAIGSITSKTLAEYGLKAQVVPKKSTLENLVQAMIDYL